ncbi:MAG: tRNA lysidine(34) synthetase TilS [Chloroflexi bacterium]|nr:tRNA lysidine(34) synthetase TilS [Chloroflexota bacterium]MCI0851340.1 tRNA lysidine(34) synthetase TilS [Chloroflexota bacterium]MCI0873471.1 tRNA lysidine(34) synthetase TilS [Chloroflexota bacterium]
MSTGSKFLEKLNAGIRRASVPNGAVLIVAFSGGPDSSALLAGLSQLRDRWSFALVGVHVNHKIRPGTSDRDQLAAQQIAGQLGVDFTAITVEVPLVAKKNNVSIESAARQLRYEALSRIASQRSAHGVVTGHTRDDQAETVLLHAGRGAGLKGIAGMRARSTLRIPDSNIEVTVLRPMLGISKLECVKFCDQSGIQPVADESNNSREYTRNRIRLDVLPQLNQAIPGSSEALARLAENAADDLAIVDWTVSRSLEQASAGPAFGAGSGHYSRPDVVSLPRTLIARVLMRAYEDYVGHSQDLERSHIVSMVDHVTGRSGTSIDLPNGVTFIVDRDSFGFRSGTEDDCPYPNPFALTELKVPGTTRLGDGFSMTAEVVDRPATLDPENPWITFASPTITQLSPRLRNRRNGDRFQPLGMEPQVKLQDYFVGAGVPERWRDRVPIVESDRGIVWVAGSRLAEWAKVRPDHKRVARLELTRPDSRTPGRSPSQQGGS